MQSVAPKSVLANISLERRNDGVGRESEHLSLLVEEIVAIHILQSVDTIAARSNTLDDEMTLAICARHTKHRLGGESAVGKVGIKTHEDALDRFEIVGSKHGACYFQGVDDIARREAISVVAHRVALVVVGNGIREVDGVGGVCLQRVEERDGDAFALRLDFRSLYLRWRHHDLFGRVVDLNKFVEIDVHLFGVDISSLLAWRSTNNPWRSFIIPSSVRVTHSCTRGYNKGNDNDCEYLK